MTISKTTYDTGCTHLLRKKKEKYIDNYFNIVTMLKINCWRCLEKDLKIIQGQRVGYNVWERGNFQIKFSYPFLTTHEFFWAKGIIEATARIDK
jgi:hypothetical protein